MKTKYTHENLIGKKFHALTYIGNFFRIKGMAAATWKCDCGSEIIGRIGDVVNGKKKSCSCYQYRRRSAHPAWGGYEEISGNYWSIVKAGARSRNLEMSVTMEEAWHQFLKQNRKCALSGEPIQFGTTKRFHDKTASLDRIDSSQGYTRNNIQWIHKDLNPMKMAMRQESFVDWCRKVAKHFA
jgi:hypothetical protein